MYCVIQAVESTVASMGLPTHPKKAPRTVSVTVRLSKRSSEQLKTLAKEHNLSQADVVEHLLEAEFTSYEERHLAAAEPNPTKKTKPG
jgi:predicted DNA-binding protein